MRMIQWMKGNSLWTTIVLRLEFHTFNSLVQEFESATLSLGCFSRLNPVTQTILTLFSINIITSESKSLPLPGLRSVFQVKTGSLWGSIQFLFSFLHSIESENTFSFRPGITPGNQSHSLSWSTQDIALRCFYVLLRISRQTRPTSSNMVSNNWTKQCTG